MLEYTQSFEEFSRSLKPIDLALYAGVGLLVWVLFKEKLSPVQKFLGSVIDQVKGLLDKKTGSSTTTVTYNTNSLFDKVSTKVAEKEDLFFKLIVSWKETRDLAVKCGCDKAVEVVDSMFPYLSPNVCAKENKDA